MIDFIADYLGFGDLPQAVAKQIKSFREWILGLIEKVFDLDHREGQGAARGGGIGKKEKGKEKDKELTVGEPITFDTPDEAHTLYIETTATGAVVMVASDKPMSVPEKLKSFESRLGEIDKKERPKVSSKIAAAKPLADQTDKAADALVRDWHREAQQRHPAKTRRSSPMRSS